LQCQKFKQYLCLSTNPGNLNLAPRPAPVQHWGTAKGASNGMMASTYPVDSLAPVHFALTMLLGKPGAKK